MIARTIYLPKKVARFLCRRAGLIHWVNRCLKYLHIQFAIGDVTAEGKEEGDERLCYSRMVALRSYMQFYKDDADALEKLCIASSKILNEKYNLPPDYEPLQYD